MGDRWGADGPPPEAYSRVTRDLDAVYDGLHDVARRLVAEVCRTHDVLRVPLRAYWVRGTDGRARPADDLVAAWWLLPADPRCLPATVALLGQWDVQVRHGWFGDRAASPVVCTCDACDEDLAEVGDALEGMLQDAVGAYAEDVRPHGVLGRSRWFSSGAATGSSGGLVEPGEALHSRLPRRASLGWPAWPARSLPT
ncbi:DUF6226 family protein [Aquipuribacter sp. SD81]|uniref:DUF6226 family protein n=1 Tax=Aquipuribacter sp. SD81 TaxID=3127703 RepID=UPI003019ACB0